MTVCVFAHCSVLRSLFEDCLEVRHVLVDIFFDVDDGTLLRIFQQVSVAEAGVEDELRECLDVGHFKLDLVAPLVGLDRLPVDVDVGLLFKTFEDRTVVRLRFGRGRIADHTGQGYFLFQRENRFFRNYRECKRCCHNSGKYH